MFSISISLTDKGVKEYERVIEIVYRFLNELREVGPKEYIFKELQAKSEIDFKYSQKTKGLDYAKRLLFKHRRLNEEDIPLMLYKDYEMSQYNP